VGRPCLEGKVIWDMHDALPAEVRILDDVWSVDYASWQVVRTNLGSQIIEGLTEDPYTNKHLVVIEDDGEDCIRAAYSYDGLRFGLIKLRLLVN